MNEVRRLVEIMARLRAPGGCPWDAEQTHRSLRPYLLEETYEVIEALDRDDLEALRGELGDLLLQIVFHAQIGSEEGSFSLEDIARGINEKLIHRHPHVFGDVEVDGAAQVLVNWEQLKLQESENAARTSALDGVPPSLPALARAMKVQKKAARVGFDWDDVDGPRAKLDEELAELDAAVADGDEDAIEREFGDVLFSMCNLARFISIDGESALRKAIARFSERFERMETAVREAGISMAELDIDGLERLWQQAKAVE